MSDIRNIKSALISVYEKENLSDVIEVLHALGVKIYSTGGTYDYIQKKGIPCIAVESLTTYPSIFGGRVKTLHPVIFGGILYRREHPEDNEEKEMYGIPSIDLVIVDLYPFEKTVASRAPGEDIIEKIDIGGISLIRAAAKNFEDVLVVPCSGLYPDLVNLLKEKNGQSCLADRKRFAAEAFSVSSHYDTAIFNYLNKEKIIKNFRKSFEKVKHLRYGENPHQEGAFYGDLDEMVEQLHGKEISYNNLVDIDASVNLVSEFSEPTVVIIKHTNACGAASRSRLTDAWADALAGDPVSAYGGVIAVNRKIDVETAAEINKLFFEVITAPDYETEALDLLKSKKNRIILKRKESSMPETLFRSLLNGVIEQSKDSRKETREDMKQVTLKQPTDDEISDLLFANILVKHTKSNAIVFVRNKQLIGSGIGQTSRVDSVKHGIAKAKEFNFDLQGAVMASDAFFPFPDCVELAFEAGITAVIEPGGSIRDEDSIKFCNEKGIAMVFTGIRHFKH